MEVVADSVVRVPLYCSWCGLFFFFSSRRRHTRLQGDWSSDVCSSDLLMSSYQQDTQMLGSVATLHAARQLNSTVAAQYQQAIAAMTVSIPYLTATKLDALSKQIQLLHAQAQDTTKYQQDMQHYRAKATRYMSIANYQDLAKQLDDDIV